MNYLIYVEHAAENLQFYLWYKDYVKRFGEAHPSDLALAPEWTQAMEDDAVAKIRKDHAEKMRPEPKAAEIFKGSDFEKQPLEAPPVSSNPFSTPPRTPRGGSGSGSDDDSVHTVPQSVTFSNATSYKSQAGDAFRSAGAKQPCTL